MGIGIEAGWNWTTLDFAAEQVSSVPLSEATVELDAFLLPEVRDPLAGTVGPDLSGTADLAIGALNFYPILNPEAPAPLQATVSGEAFTATGAGQSFAMQAPLVVPTEDHLYEIADLPLVRAGIFRPLVWIDGNGSLIYETGEAVMTGTDATLFYLDATDWRAVLYRGSGFVMGWNLVRNEQVVAWNDGLVLGGT